MVEQLDGTLAGFYVWEKGGHRLGGSPFLPSSPFAVEAAAVENGD